MFGSDIWRWYIGRPSLGIAGKGGKELQGSESWRRNLGHKLERTCKRLELHSISQRSSQVVISGCITFSVANILLMIMTSAPVRIPCVVEQQQAKKQKNPHLLIPALRPIPTTIHPLCFQYVLSTEKASRKSTRFKPAERPTSLHSNVKEASVEFSALSWVLAPYCLYPLTILAVTRKPFWPQQTQTLRIKSIVCRSVWNHSRLKVHGSVLSGTALWEIYLQGWHWVPALTGRERIHPRKRRGCKFLLRETMLKNSAPALTCSLGHVYMKEVIHTSHAAIHYSQMLFTRHKIWEFSFKLTSFTCNTAQKPMLVVSSIKHISLNQKAWK